MTRPPGEELERATEDGRLLRRIALGDPVALEDAFQRCSGRALALALNVLQSRSDAEEIVQEVFLHLWQRARDFDPARGDLSAWVCTLTRSRAIDRVRSWNVARRYAESASGEAAPERPGVPVPSDLVEQREAQDRLASALRTLPEVQRAALQLAYFEGLSHREIAERTGEPLGTVKTRVRAGMISLASKLAPEQEAASAQL
jgi:RNA polymerase sigma-70 factor, ECF subfamily